MNTKKNSVPYPDLEIEGLTDKKVLQAIRSLPRKLFISKELQKEAYSNKPLPIDCGQTISQPFIVAYMTEKLDLKPNDRVLEIGTGSGFQTAVLAQIVFEIYTIETYPWLSQKAQQLLTRLGYENINYKIGDGKEGWPEFAPFDKIIITAAAQQVPHLLLEQLKIGGKMILPLEVESGEQWLVLINKSEKNRVEYKQLIPVRFVPLK